MVIDKILKKKIEKKIVPKHIAIVVEGIINDSRENKKLIKDKLIKSQKNLHDIFINQTKMNIPIITIYLNTKNVKKNPENEEIMKFLCELLSELKKDFNINKNKVKVSVLGKWYDLNSAFVDEIKDLINETKDYDNFFLNFCLNYDGQEEIVDACKIISKKIEAGIIKSNSINKEIIKENTYSSYFLPPDLIIVTGRKSSTQGVLLWDSKDSTIYFSKVMWTEFDNDYFIKAINYFRKERCK